MKKHIIYETWTPMLDINSRCKQDDWIETLKMFNTMTENG